MHAQPQSHLVLCSAMRRLWAWPAISRHTADMCVLLHSVPFFFLWGLRGYKTSLPDPKDRSIINSMFFKIKLCYHMKKKKKNKLKKKIPQNVDIFLLEFHFFCSLLAFLVCLYRHIGPCFSINSDK